MKKTKEIRDDRLLEDKVQIVAKGLLKIDGMLSKNELCKCIRMLEDPELAFIAEVESKTNLKVRIKTQLDKRYFEFYYMRSPSVKGSSDQVTITELPTLENAQAFLKGYLTYYKHGVYG